jgi:hypothetical protein
MCEDEKHSQIFLGKMREFCRKTGDTVNINLYHYYFVEVDSIRESDISMGIRPQLFAFSHLL